MTLRSSLRSSATWYIGTLAVGVVLARAGGYFWFERPLILGQPSNVLIQWAVFGVAAVAWLVLGKRERARGLLLVFLVSMSIAWFVHLLLYRWHGDAFNYAAILYVPILMMVMLKPPTTREALQSVTVYAWTVTAVILFTLLVEVLGQVSPKPQSPDVIAFDEARYWLPFNDALGIDGRWTGPFSHNGDTAMMGALLIVIAFVKWQRSSWVFLGTGALVLLLTFGRASIGAALVGLLVIFMLTEKGRAASVPRRLRIGFGALAGLAVAVFMLTRPAGVTGRNNFWAAFIDLWLTSPLVGVGSSGISVSGGITQQWGHAHNMYIDELARYGLLGFSAQIIAIAVGLVIVGMAAARGFPGPLAVVITYLVTAVTEPRNDWIHPSVITVLLLLMVALAAASLERPRLDSTSGEHIDPQGFAGIR